MSRSSAACIAAALAAMGILASIVAMYALGRSPVMGGAQGPTGEMVTLPFIAAFGIWAVVNAVRARKVEQSAAARVVVYFPVALFLSFCVLVLGPFLTRS